MLIKIDTTIGNGVISDKLKAMLTDLRSNTQAILDSVEEIKIQGTQNVLKILKLIF
jgi:hypothetical protein